ncbi:hypothetical protein IAT38_001525 [Cryptococcus sp. DSM 104549]
MTTQRSTLQSAVQHISSTPGSFTLVESSPSWPRGHVGASPTSDTLPPIHIAVLDSSFNPPTLAHQTIASSSSLSSSLPFSSTAPPPYTARLLLFSARNVSKTLKPTDATPVQRLEMMSLLAEDLRAAHQDEVVAVGLINEPTFVGKAGIIRSWLDEHAQEADVDLTFLVGTDTLVRIFDPAFYPPGEMGSKLEKLFRPPPEGYGAQVVSARRGTSAEDRVLEDELLDREDVRGWVEKGQVRMLGSGEEGWEEVSSTRVREAVKADDKEGLKKLVGGSIGEYIAQEGLYSS